MGLNGFTFKEFYKNYSRMREPFYSKQLRPYCGRAFLNKWMVEGLKIEGGLSTSNNIWGGAKNAPPPAPDEIGSTDLQN